MKIMKRVIVVCITMLLCGCDLVHWNETYLQSYTWAYCVIDDKSEAEVVIGGDKIFFSLPLEKYAIRDESSGAYDELSRLYGDDNFNTWSYWLVFGPKSNSWAFPFSTFEIVGVADFDDHHPAGALLNDVVEITYTTHKFFIENGYQHTDKGRASDDYSGNQVTKKLSELLPDDAIFMEPESFVLSFSSQPTIAQQNRFSLKVCLEGEEPYIVEFDMDFGASE